MTNNNGLDEHYFKLKLELIVQGIHNYTPEELARALVRLARTANEDVMMAEVTIIARQQIRDRVAARKETYEHK